MLKSIKNAKITMSRNKAIIKALWLYEIADKKLPISAISEFSGVKGITPENVTEGGIVQIPEEFAHLINFGKASVEEYSVAMATLYSILVGL